MPLLSAMTWLPIICGFAILLAVQAKLPKRFLQYSCLAASIASLIIGLYVSYNFDISIGAMQFKEVYPWLTELNINYSLGIDGFSLLLCLLTIGMTLLVIINSFNKVSYMATFLIMQGLMTGVFLALDAILFYLFFEAMMIPMFLIIGIWGSDNRIYATIKFILYTLFASIFLLVAILYLYKISSSFAILDYQSLPLSLQQQKWLFWAFLIPFAVKIPMWPVHTWLPDAHTEAPTAGSVILAAITLKIGAYGMLRFLLPIVPNGCEYYSKFVLVLSLIAIVYIGLLAISQKDMKKLVAYSSIAHMGFVTLGLFVACNLRSEPDYAQMAIEGAVIQMISHGFVAAALFLCVGVLYKRTHSRMIADYTGVVNSMPIFATFFMLFALANVGMPGTSGFVGEFLVILASIKVNIWYTVAAASTLILAPAYTLWMYKRVIFGETTNAISALKDVSLDEKIVFAILAACLIVFGVWPDLLLKTMQASSATLAKHLALTK